MDYNATSAWTIPAADLEQHRSNHRSPWIQLFSGRKFWPLDPHPSEVFIKDVAHNLSMVCRFGGAVRKFYSVAEHCVRLSLIVPAGYALKGLLHEGDEIWGMPDLSKPIKHHPDFKPLWDFYGGRQQAAVDVRFGLCLHMPAAVKHADNVMLITEQRDIVGPQVEPWSVEVEPLPERIEPWTQEQAEERFLARFHELGGRYADGTSQGIESGRV